MPEQTDTSAIIEDAIGGLQGKDDRPDARKDPSGDGTPGAPDAGETGTAGDGVGKATASGD